MLHPQQNALQIKDLQGALKVLGEHVGDANHRKWRSRHQSDVAGTGAIFREPRIGDERAGFCCVRPTRRSHLSGRKGRINSLHATLRLASRGTSMAMSRHIEADPA